MKRFTDRREELQRRFETLLAEARRLRAELETLLGPQGAREFREQLWRTATRNGTSAPKPA